MRVNVRMNPRAVRKLTEAQLISLQQTAEQLRSEVITEGVIPFDEGTLQNVQTYVDTKKLDKGEVSIAHDTPYARRLYYNPQFNFNRTINPKARGEWWSDWLEGAKRKRPSQIFKAIYRMVAGRYVK